MSLQTWLSKGWVTEHQTSPEEIADLLSVVERDLTDCQTPGLSPDWRLNIAYNAALQSASAALYAAGYRAGRDANHYRVVHSLEYTIGAHAALIGQLDKFRKKRNILDYERAGIASDQEAKEMRVLAQKLRDHVVGWLRSKHPGLLRGW